MPYPFFDKTISIFVFEKGPIVITGAKNCEHILSGYNFINKYLLTNHMKVVKSAINISNINTLFDDPELNLSEIDDDEDEDDDDYEDKNDLNNFMKKFY